jgi:hypothetical protein
MLIKLLDEDSLSSEPTPGLKLCIRVGIYFIFRLTRR